MRPTRPLDLGGYGLLELVLKTVVEFVLPMVLLEAEIDDVAPKPSRPTPLADAGLRQFATLYEPVDRPYVHPESPSDLGAVD